MFWSIARKKLALDKGQLLLLYIFLTMFATLLTSMVLAFPVSNYYYNQAFSNESFDTEISGPFTQQSITEIEKLAGAESVTEFALYREVKLITKSESQQVLVIASKDKDYINRSWVDQRDVIASSRQESAWIDLDSVSAQRLSAKTGDSIEIDLGDSTRNVTVRNVLSFKHFAADALAIVDATALNDQYQTNLVLISDAPVSSADLKKGLGPSFSVLDRVEVRDSIAEDLPYADRVILLIGILAFIASVAIFMREAAVLKDRSTDQKQLMQLLGAPRRYVVWAYLLSYISVNLLAMLTAYIITVLVVYPSTSFGSIPPTLLKYVVLYFASIAIINAVVLIISQSRVDNAGDLERKGVRF